MRSHLIAKKLRKIIETGKQSNQQYRRVERENGQQPHSGERLLSDGRANVDAVYRRTIMISSQRYARYHLVSYASRLVPHLRDHRSL